VVPQPRLVILHRRRSHEQRLPTDQTVSVPMSTGIAESTADAHAYFLNIAPEVQ
jgi:hypothetical protein